VGAEEKGRGRESEEDLEEVNEGRRDGERAREEREGLGGQEGPGRR
jgi:hypothetical protein